MPQAAEQQAATHCNGSMQAAKAAHSAPVCVVNKPKPWTEQGVEDTPLPQQTEYTGLLEALCSSPKQLPCSFLYDATGSALYEQITELEEYYPFRTEARMLKQHADAILSHIQPGSIVVELGCGSAQKTGILLNALLERDGPDRVHFIGVDVSLAALEFAKASLLEGCPGLLAGGVELVCAEYIQGVEECRARHPGTQLCILWLGSSVGNLDPGQAVQFFTDMQAVAGTNIQVFLCADLWKDVRTLHAAYCDGQGVTEAFIKNGMRHALATLGHPEAGHHSNWDYEVVVNPKARQVEMWLTCRKALPALAQGVSFTAGERVLVEVSRKFTAPALQGMAYRSGLYIQAAWRSADYSMQMLVPPLAALRECWADTDALFARIPDWAAHPISVRHPFAFYYGHVAAFAKLKVLPHLPSSGMDTMLSRGIDPNVLDPSQCHAHPDIPPAWPSRAQLQAYVDDVRRQMSDAVKGGVVGGGGGGAGAGVGRPAMRQVVLAVEHERMHLETLEYMLAQQVKADFMAGAEPPITPAPSPDIASIGDELPEVFIPGGAAVLGVPGDGSAGFTWDNEGPPQAAVDVAPFKVASLPVTVAQFYRFAVDAGGYGDARWWEAEDWTYLQEQKQALPATWSMTPGGRVFVHTPHGSAHWSSVRRQPVLCSLAEAAAFCAWAGGKARLTTEAEHQRILDVDNGARVLKLREGGWEWTATIFAPFPGFQAMADYPEYSADFFDGRHYVLKGGSAATHPAMLRDSFRNFYQRQYPYMFAKFRCAYDA